MEPRKGSAQNFLSLKIVLTVLLSIFLLYWEFMLIMLITVTRGGSQIGFVFLALMPLLLYGFLWLPKKKAGMLSLAAVYALFSVGMMTAFGVDMCGHLDRHNSSYEDPFDGLPAIDTAPAIDVSAYLPFREDSKIVKHRSETLRFSENAPVIDGAAALFPVYSAFVHATYPTDTALGEGAFQYNNTPNGYKALAEQRTDLFIGVYPSEAQLAYAEENGTHLTFTPIGYDAFVFFVHKDNPIESLTADEIRAIYAGEITNWKQLGGSDEEIIAFQRNEGSGSQSMLRRFMGDTPLMEAPVEKTVAGMGGIIEEVADYRSTTSSIGFSFRFYVEGIIKNPDIKMIAVDGVAPSADNVRDESYPIRTPFYAVTYEENKNPHTETLIDWILSAEGQTIIEETGYIGVKAEDVHE